MKLLSVTNEVGAGEQLLHIEGFLKKSGEAERDRLQMPEKIIEVIDLSDDARAIELWTGTGYFVVQLTKT